MFSTQDTQRAVRCTPPPLPPPPSGHHGNPQALFWEDDGWCSVCLAFSGWYLPGVVVAEAFGQLTERWTNTYNLFQKKSLQDTENMGQVISVFLMHPNCLMLHHVTPCYIVRLCSVQDQTEAKKSPVRCLWSQLFSGRPKIINYMGLWLLVQHVFLTCLLLSTSEDSEAVKSSLSLEIEPRAWTG